METEAAVKKMKTLKSKAKAALKAGNKTMAKTFKVGATRLSRKVRAAARATAPAAKKKE